MGLTPERILDTSIIVSINPIPTSRRYFLSPWQYYKTKPKYSDKKVKPKFVKQQNSLLSYVFGAICEPEIVLPVPPILRIKTKQFHVCNLYKTCKTSQAKQFSEGVVAKPIEYYQTTYYQVAASDTQCDTIKC